MRRARITAGLVTLVLLASLLPASVAFAGTPSSVTLAGPVADVDEGTDVQLTATITADPGYDTEGAIVTFHETSDAMPDCTAAVDTSGTVCHLGSSLAVGSYTFEATYSGNSIADPSPPSDPLTFDVVAVAPPPPTPGPSSTTITGPSSAFAGDDVTLTADVVANAGYQVGAKITFHATAGGGPDCTDVDVDTSGTLCDLGSGLAVGPYTYTATYSGNDAAVSSVSDPFSFDIVAVPDDPQPSSVSLSGPGTIVVGSDAVLTADVTAPAGYDAGATIDFNAVAGGGPDCQDVPVDTSGTTCDLGSGLATGSYTYEAVYSGNAGVLTSTSTQVVIDVTDVPDTAVDATGVSIDVTTFYPAKDGYRDKVLIGGMRNEPISVVIRAYNSSNKRVLSTSIALGSGAYSYGWSGRNSAGTMLASGRYKVVQTLHDGSGNTLVVTKYTTLSQKKLVTKTTYVTKAGRSISAQSSPILVSKSGYAKLDARSVIKNVGYQFSIPSATRYKSLSFQVYAKGPKTAPSSAIGMQDFAWCAYVAHSWDLGCFDRVRTIGGSGTKWYSTGGSITANRSGRVVRGVVSAAGGVYYVYKVRVKVVYQVLR